MTECILGRKKNINGKVIKEKQHHKFDTNAGVRSISSEPFCFVVTEVMHRLVYEQGSPNFVGARNTYRVEFISCTILT
jgi:hypothetical protein